MEKNIETKPVPFQKQQWIIFGLLGTLTLFSGLAYAIQGPFYPIEAESKGVSIAVIGFVYGIHELANFFVSPIIGSLMKKVGAVSGLYYGIIFTFLGTSGLGALGFLQNTSWFISLSVLCRIIQSIGATFRAIAVISIVTFSFQNAIATAFAIIESIFGLGMSLGVVVAGSLMEVTGFIETFIISGLLLLLTLPLAIIVLRKYEISPTTSDDSHKTNTAVATTNGNHNGTIISDHNKQEKNTQLQKSRRPIGIFTLLSTPRIALAVFGLVSAAICLGFMMGVLQPHLKQFNLSPFSIGLMFLYPPLAYVIASPIFGRLYDKIQPCNLYYAQFIAPSLMFVSFSMVGPAPYIPMQASKWMVSFGLVMLGIGLSSAFVSSFLIAVQEGKKLGTKEDEMRVHELISGIWRSAISLGMFTGPSIGGALYVSLGFSQESLLIIGLQLIHIAFIISCKCMKTKPPTISTVMTLENGTI